jgi:AraC family transcriptional regulator of adaptative response/methylated-DNA-[protein]-cysteine methyltransferase
MITQHPKEKISDQQLREAAISPDLIRRWFKKNYGITFHAFQRMYRINNAYKELKDGKTSTITAYESGYESLSGFAYTYKKVLGRSPSNSPSQHIILINRLSTPLGPMFVAATEKGICLLEFTDRKMLETEFRDLQKLLKATILVGENQHIKQAKEEIQAYFDGKRRNFDVPLDAPGTDFQKEVWQKLSSIPLGTTSTYQALAAQLNKPKAVRAVARANGFNRISIIIPCHRIIGKDGRLRGYGGGLERKRWLIDFEKGLR